MRNELGQFERYLRETLGVTVTTAPWPGSASLPHFLRELYGFAQAILLETPCLLLVDSNPEEQSPAILRKHIDLLRAKWQDEVIYVRAQVTSYNRKRLIEKKIAFVVPGNQMYLPTLGVDLREHFRRLHSEPLRFNPSTQVVVLYMLLRGTDQVLIPSEIAQRLGYSAMTMSRAFDEIEAARLGELTAHGRERRLRFGEDKQQTWARAEPFLRSPVSKRVCVRHVDLGAAAIRAGLTALSQSSMLALPARPVYAMSREDWRSLRQREQMLDVSRQDPDAQEIEVWSYAPALLAQNKTVDPLSLYLSLKDADDERIASSLNEMMVKLGWSEA